MQHLKRVKKFANGAPLSVLSGDELFRTGIVAALPSPPLHRHRAPLPVLRALLLTI
jgi:hypothetical protein